MLLLASCHCSGLWLQTLFWRHFLQDMIQLHFLLVTFIYLKVKAPLLTYFFLFVCFQYVFHSQVAHSPRTYVLLMMLCSTLSQSVSLKFSFLTRCVAVKHTLYLLASELNISNPWFPYSLSVCTTDTYVQLNCLKLQFKYIIFLIHYYIPNIKLLYSGI